MITPVFACAADTDRNGGEVVTLEWLLLIMWQVTGALVLILALYGLMRLLLRSAIRNEARKAYTDFMTQIHDWSIRRNDLEITARAIAALDAHKDKLQRAAQAQSDKRLLSWRDRIFQLEYARCHARHRAMMNLDYPDNEMFEQAVELQEGINALQVKRDGRVTTPQQVATDNSRAGNG